MSPTEVALDVSIVTYNSAPVLPRLLASLTKQSFDRRRIALIFADNGSRDDTVALLEQWRHEHAADFGAIHILRGSNDGFGAGHNRAAAASSAPFLFVLNPDTELPPECIARLHAVAAGDEARVAAWEARQLPYEHPKDYDPVTLETGWFSGACVVLRRAAFDAVGGFDPAYFLYCEDVDLSWRLRAAGWRLRYVPRATVRHFTYAAPGEVKPAQLVGSSIGNLYLRARFGTRRDLLQGLSAYADRLGNAPPLPGVCRQLAANLATFAGRYAHFAGGGGGARFRFFGWDYAPRRSGDYFESVSSDELPRHPKVSILVRTTGRLPLLRRALASIANQTYAPIEVILVEDGGDRARVVGAEFPALDLVYVPLERSVGRSAAGNAALTRASGELCNFLDEDDELYADHVEQLVAALVRTGQPVAYATALEVPSRIEADTLVEEGDAAVVFRGPISRLTIGSHNQLPIQSVLFERRLFRELGGFDESLDAHEDWHLWVRYLAHVGSFVFVDKTTSRYRVPLDAASFAARHERLDADRLAVQQRLDHMQIHASFAELREELDRARAAERDELWAQPRPVSWWVSMAAKVTTLRAYHGIRIAVRDLFFPERPRRPR
jgi:GT2 family glycosyltransferase